MKNLAIVGLKYDEVQKIAQTISKGLGKWSLSY